MAAKLAETQSLHAFYASVNSSCDHPPPPGQPPGIGKFSFFSCKCPGVGPKKRNNAPPLGRKTKQMPHPQADKLVNFKECTKLITCVLTICIYTPVNCSFGNLPKKQTRKTIVFISDENIDERLWHTCFYCRKFFIVNTRKFKLRVSGNGKWQI